MSIKEERTAGVKLENTAAMLALRIFSAAWTEAEGLVVVPSPPPVCKNIPPVHLVPSHSVRQRSSGNYTHLHVLI